MTKADLTALRVQDNWIWWPPVEERWICWPHCSLARVRWLGENGESRQREQERRRDVCARSLEWLQMKLIGLIYFSSSPTYITIISAKFFYRISIYNYHSCHGASFYQSGKPLAPAFFFLLQLTGVRLGVWLPGWVMERNGTCQRVGIKFCHVL